jgi:hypothetical protein
MHFRTEEVPYTGLLVCGRKIVAEEGWGVLARAWWLTVIRMVLSLALGQVWTRVVGFIEGSLSGLPN